MENENSFLIAFNEAESFYAAFNYINEMASSMIKFSDTAKFMGICRAIDVNHVFAIEMYFKCISLITSNKYKQGHDLIKLFNFLNKDVQELIISHYNEKYKPYEEEMLAYTLGGKKSSFVELLSLSKDTFISSRYIFSQDRNSYKLNGYRLQYILPTIRDVCVIYKPELNKEMFPLL